MSTSTSSIFTGASQFSQDFQNVITRAVSIASLPLTQMQSDQTTFKNEASALTGLDSKFAALQTAIAGVGSAVGGGSFQSDVSDPSAIDVTLGDGAQEGEYSIDVQNVGAYATSLSLANWSAASGQRTYQVYVGAAEFDITPADNSASSVAASINAAGGGKVRATVVNVGSASAPDDRIAMQGVALGDLPVDIRYNGTSLQHQQTQGQLAQYIVNGSGNTVESASRSVEISNGVTVTMLAGDAGNPVDITVTRSTTALSNALSALAGAYNDAVAAVGAQRGAAGGALSGQSVVYQLGQALGGLGTYFSPGGDVTGLTSIGLELQKDGTIKFNAPNLMAADLNNSAAVTAFLGTATGGGFLKAATDALNGLEAPTTGALKAAETGTQTQIDDVGAQITAKQDQITRLQTQLQTQMTAADAAIATMEQQYDYLSGLFTAMQTDSQQYK